MKPELNVDPWLFVRPFAVLATAVVSVIGIAMVFSDWRALVIAIPSVALFGVALVWHVRH